MLFIKWIWKWLISHLDSEGSVQVMKKTFIICLKKGERLKRQLWNSYVIVANLY